MDKSTINYNELPITSFRWTNANYLELNNVEHAKKDFHNIEFKMGNKSVLSEDVNSVISAIPNYYKGSNKIILEEALKDNNVKQVLIAKEGEEKSLHMTYKLDKDNNVLIGHLSVFAEKNSKINLIIDFEENDIDETYYVNFLTEVHVEENAEVNITKIQNHNFKTRHIEQRYTSVEKDSKIDFITVNLGAKESILNYLTELKGDSSNAEIRAIYMGEDHNIIDFSNHINFYGKKTEGNLEVKGVLKDFSKKFFRGTLDYKKGSAKSLGGEEEIVLLLDKTVKSFAIPILLCGEDDVIGNHAASTGQIDDEQLFYLMTRGLDREYAKKLIVEAMFKSVIDTIEDDEIKELTLKQVHKKLYER